MVITIGYKDHLPLFAKIVDILQGFPIGVI